MTSLKSSSFAKTATFHRIIFKFSVRMSNTDNIFKKFELMFTRRAKAYSSSCSQTVSLSPTILSQPEIAKNP